MMADDLCQCRKCGRVHRHLGIPPVLPSECAHAIKLANAVLDGCDQGKHDPDGDLAVLARQFLRALEREV
jgi:hypothetical protein